MPIDNGTRKLGAKARLAPGRQWEMPKKWCLLAGNAVAQQWHSSQHGHFLDVGRYDAGWENGEGIDTCG